jgi:hypothetical protein
MDLAWVQENKKKFNGEMTCLVHENISSMAQEN